MKPDRINYQKTFNLGNYTSERIGMEAEIDSMDDPKECINYLKEQVEAYHKENNPQLQDQFGVGVLRPPYSSEELGLTPITQVEKPVDRIKSIIEDINSCTEIKVLESYRLMAKRNPELQEAYDNKLKQLQ